MTHLFNPGDLLRCDDDEHVREVLTKGEIYEFVGTSSLDPALIDVKAAPDKPSITGVFPHRFTKVAVADLPKVPPVLEDVVVIDQPVAVVRAYDYAAGDRRFFDREKAVAHAQSKAAESGVRQQVRLSGSAIGGGAPLWLVQDIA